MQTRASVTQPPTPVMLPPHAPTPPALPPTCHAPVGLPSCVSMSSRWLSGVGGSVTWFMTGGTTVFTSSASQPPRGAPPPPAPPPPPPEPLAVRRPPRSRLPAQPFLPDTGTFKACLLAMRPMSAACHHPRHQGQPHTHIDCGATRHYRDLLPPQITGRSSPLRGRALGYRWRSFIHRDLSTAAPPLAELF